MKKVIGQTVRDLKREVNKKVLKVPGIEQKVLDATSNEPWGPHGLLLADIAQATRNYHEYQMIMAVIWKRINDTGKNWRHVYKALTVLEYLVANGSERVIDEIREHAYQISTLSDFQYIDSSGKDQGNNVRKKSQSLVLLVNDKDRIMEVRQKAAANRDKFRNTSTDGMHGYGSYSSSGAYGNRYEDDHYGSRDEDRNGYGYGREREWGYRDDDRNSRDGERYGRDNDKDDEHRGRSQSVDDYRYGSRSRSSDRDRDRSYDDDGQYSSRGSSAKAENHSLEGRLEQKFSEKNMGAPPSYEEAVGESRSPVHSERDGETSAAAAPSGSSLVSNYPNQTSTPSGSPPANSNPAQETAAPSVATSANQEVEAFDEFDPRGPTSAAPAASNNVEMDLLGSLSESFSSNTLALMPATTETTTAEANGYSAPSFAAAASGSSNINQSFDDPFGDSPFKAIPSTETGSSQPQTYQSLETPQSAVPNAETVSNFGFADSFSGVSYPASGVTHTQPFSTDSQFPIHDMSTAQQETDILADILPPAPLPTMMSQQNISVDPAQPSPPTFSTSTGQPASQSFPVPASQLAPQAFSASTGQPVQQSFSAPSGQHSQPFLAPSAQHSQPFSAPSGHHAEPFSTLGGQHGQPFSASNGQHAQPVSAPSGQHAQPFSSPTSQPAQQFFSAHAGQPAQQPFSAHAGQPAQQPFSTPAGHPEQQPFSAHAGQSAQQPFSAHAGQPAQQPFSGPAGLPEQQPISARAGQPAQQPFSPHASQSAQQPFSVVPSQTRQNAFSSPIDQSIRPSFSVRGGQPAQSVNMYSGFQSQPGLVTPGTSNISSQFQNGYNGQISSGSFLPQGSTALNPSHMPPQTSTEQVSQTALYFSQPGGSAAHSTSHMVAQSDHASQFSSGNFVAQQGTALWVAGGKQNNGVLGGLLGQAGVNSSSASQYAASSVGSNSVVSQPSKDKFETKSTVWTDTLSRGLVNLNISGPKINPLADIGIDFDAINRKEKRMEKPTTTSTVTSTLTMGKAMGSGSGVGRAGAGALRPQSNPMMGSGMGMGMGMGMGNSPGVGMGMGMGMSMGGYGGMNTSMGMGMGMSMGMGMGMGMNMGMGQGVQMQQPMGLPPGSNIPGNYNSMMGTGGYTQQPYGGGYR